MSASRPQWDAARTLERLGGDERLFQEVIEIFLEEGPRQMASMRAALTRGDKDATERIAHTLKGELGYLGLPEASRCARELEDAGRNGDLEHAVRIHSSLEREIERATDVIRGVLRRNSIARSPGAD